MSTTQPATNHNQHQPPVNTTQQQPMISADYGNLRPRVAALRRRKRRVFFDSADHFLNPGQPPHQPHPHIFASQVHQPQPSTSARPQHGRAATGTTTATTTATATASRVRPLYPAMKPQSSNASSAHRYGCLVGRPCVHREHTHRAFFDSADYFLHPDAPSPQPHPRLFAKRENRRRSPPCPKSFMGESHCRRSPLGSSTSLNAVGASHRRSPPGPSPSAAARYAGIQPRPPPLRRHRVLRSPRTRTFFDSADFVLHPEETPRLLHPRLFNTSPVCENPEHGAHTKSACGPSSTRRPHT
jgi:hypothetical protein